MALGWLQAVTVVEKLDKLLGFEKRIHVLEENQKKLMDKVFFKPKSKRRKK